MKKSVMKKWVKALRSGEYQQCRGKLYSYKNGSYCCMGVLGSILGATNFNLSERGYLNPKELMAVELQTENGRFGKEQDENLIQQNDKLRKSFIEIADIIEANYEKL